MGVPQCGWFMVEDPSINGWFRGTPIAGNLRIYIYMYIIYHISYIIYHISNIITSYGSYRVSTMVTPIKIPYSYRCLTSHIERGYHHGFSHKITQLHSRLSMAFRMPRKQAPAVAAVATAAAGASGTTTTTRPNWPGVSRARWCPWGLWLFNSLLLKIVVYSWFTHWKWWFSIVMLVYRRVYSLVN